MAKELSKHHGKQYGGPPKCKVELQYDLSVPFLTIYIKELKADLKKNCITMLIAALFTISKK